ncbi:hypothetical protein [Fructilactobacillus carniphilus]|uniref:Uncharacterized protein n=1 Tax=Fructilactobacillus carniphilus TaxID=2940297 RepID=A0ABY5BUW1_9LACO|nr:hypothetical protein [Fructilactobacillus carniphilus]USS90294.1 hypothetical protein M3M37_05475 [Fructilactobacillus carniphilus]
MDKRKLKELNEQLANLKKAQISEENQTDAYYQEIRSQSRKIMDSLTALGANGDLAMQKLSTYMANQDLELSRLLRTISATSNDYFCDKKRQLENKVEEEQWD